MSQNDLNLQARTCATCGADLPDPDKNLTGWLTPAGQTIHVCSVECELTAGLTAITGLKDETDSLEAIRDKQAAEITRLQGHIDEAFDRASSGDAHGARVALTKARWGCAW